ncbi:hypothetical protein MUK42_32567 [Musa troglodytarum]|uniref:Uncharacterized protein n=1 Tax=Musa troglodytarum TaxID=320322 RepID=A0A9E7FGP8_9LILI|nr:hypothetical protein MUK42_32567 [Musa troglodytarum]
MDAVIISSGTDGRESRVTEIDVTAWGTESTVCDAPTGVAMPACWGRHGTGSPSHFVTPHVKVDETHSQGWDRRISPCLS